MPLETEDKGLEEGRVWGYDCRGGGGIMMIEDQASPLVPNDTVHMPLSVLVST